MSKKVDPTKMRVEFCSIRKDHLLDILKAECVVPEAATRIIGTGHRPEELTVTVGFD